MTADAHQTVQIPNLVSYFVHKHPQSGLRRYPESSKSFPGTPGELDALKGWPTVKAQSHSLRSGIYLRNAQN